MWLGSPPAAFTGRLRPALRGLLGLHVAALDGGNLLGFRQTPFIDFLRQASELVRHHLAFLPLGAFVLILPLLAHLVGLLPVRRSTLTILHDAGVIAATGDN